MSAKSTVKPRIHGVNLDSALGDWRVIAHNNDTTRYDDVVRVLMTACQYDQRTAEGYTRKIHLEGRCVVFWGNEEKCKAICAALGHIGVKTDLERND